MSTHLGETINAVQNVFQTDNDDILDFRYPIRVQIESEQMDVIGAGFVGSEAIRWSLTRGVAGTAKASHAVGTAITAVDASSSGGSGGVSVASGAVIQRSANVSVSSSDPLPFNTVFEDTDGYWDAGNGRLAIPTGKAGLFVYGAKVETAATASLTGLWVDLSISGNAANGQFAGGKRPGGLNPRFYAAASFVEVFAEGDTITPSWELDGVAAASMLGGGNGSTFFIAYLGPLT